MNNIILIGMTGAGKTTLGKLLAKKTLRPFIDTDELFVSTFGKTPRDIVVHDGREAFLKKQTEVILQLKAQNHVIATGGSVLESLGVPKYLKILGTVVYLSVPFEIIEQRMDSSRPLAKNENQTVYELFTQREKAYQKNADIMIECFQKSKEEIISCIIQKVNEVQL